MFLAYCPLHDKSRLEPRIFDFLLPCHHRSHFSMWLRLLAEAFLRQLIFDYDVLQWQGHAAPQ